MGFRDSIQFEPKSVISRYNLRRPEHLLPIVGVASGILLAVLNYVYVFSAYQNLMASIGIVQAIITGYLSYKIFSIGRQDSGLPKFKLGVVDSWLSELPATEETECKCEVILKNEAFGGAKIRDIEVSFEYSTEKIDFANEPDSETPIKYKDGNGPPITLNKNQEITLGIYIPDFVNFESFTLEIDESKIGNKQYTISGFSLGALAMDRQTDVIDEIFEDVPGDHPDGELWIE